MSLTPAQIKWRERRNEIMEENKRRRAMRASAEWQIERIVTDLSYNATTDPVAEHNLKRDDSEMERYISSSGDGERYIHI
jgi:hypothetical protein